MELFRVVRARGTAGTVTPADVASAEAEVSLAAAATLDGEGALVEATAELRFAVASVAGEELSAVGDLAATDDTPSDEEHALGLALEHNPSIAAARFRALTYDRDATLAHALWAPTLSVGASLVREGNGENVLQGIVAFPFPFSRPGAFEGARARAQADAELKTEDLEKAQVTRDVAMALHERQHTREVRAVLQTALAPLREAERLARITLDAGTRDITALLLARARRIATEERWIRALANVHRADLRFGRVIGRIPWRQP
jgi:outer membrane protein